MYQYHVCSDALRRAYHLCGILAQNIWPLLNHEKTSDKPKLRDHIHNWLVFIKYQGNERQRKTEEMSEVEN